MVLDHTRASCGTKETLDLSSDDLGLSLGLLFTGWIRMSKILHLCKHQFPYLYNQESDTSFHKTAAETKENVFESSLQVTERTAGVNRWFDFLNALIKDYQGFSNVGLKRSWKYEGLMIHFTPRRETMQ